MRVPFVDLHAQYLALKEVIDGAVRDVIEKSAFIRGEYVERFEKEWSAAIGVRHCISCGNGTDALYVALRALGVEPGQEIITTAHSWIATSETITQAGGTVVFADTLPDTFTIDPRHFESKITERTVGVVPVHLYGQPADLDAVVEIAERHGLWVLEDSAQAHLAEYKGRTVGSAGNVATFSFYPGKNLGAMGDGGCIVTDDDDIAEWATLFARHGGKGVHAIEGINSRMDGIQAAILCAKLPHLEEWTRARRDIADYYREQLDGVGDLVLPVTAADRTHVFHLFVVRTEQRDELRSFLAEHGVSTGVNYPTALPFCPAYARLGHTPEDFPVAFGHQSRIVSLPIYPEMTREQQDHVVGCVADFFA